jgi:cobalt/nickel transport system permease protein
VHIPDGFLNVKVWAPATVAGASVVGYALKRANHELKGKQIPLISLIGAFIFAAQMINFPISGATSGHFLGGTLAAILFGPWISIVIMSAVLIVQAMLFQDGGITVLGANILCTAVIGTFIGFGVYRAGMIIFRDRLQTVVTFLAAWLSIIVASIGVACLLSISGTLPFHTAMIAMVSWHSLIGIGEGIITVFVLKYLGHRQLAGGRRRSHVNS